MACRRLKPSELYCKGILFIWYAEIHQITYVIDIIVIRFDQEQYFPHKAQKIIIGLIELDGIFDGFI